MKTERVMIDGIPVVIYGEESPEVYLFVHGKDGAKEEALAFAEAISAFDCQVLAMDLPGHGERKAEMEHFKPWYVVPELKNICEAAEKRWSKLSLRGNSIGAWFSMLSFTDVPLQKVLFVSPILDMENLIRTMMVWAGVSEEDLKKAGEIETNFGETLSWEYLEYACENPIVRWNHDTSILYPDVDQLTPREITESFGRRFHCRLQMMENGEHWFHTPEQRRILADWEKAEQ